MAILSVLDKLTELLVQLDCISCRMLPSSVIIVITMDVYPTQTLLHCYDAVGIAC